VRLIVKNIILDNQQLNDLLDQVRQRANAAEEALESAEERVEKYRSTIEASNHELSELREKVALTFLHEFVYLFRKCTRELK
jgi:chromosome segregation ATPase